MVMERIKQFIFGRDTTMVNPPKDSVLVQAQLTSGLVEQLIAMSRFQHMSDEEIHEQLYKFEPEVGGSIDRSSTLVCTAYRGIYLDSIPNTIDAIRDESSIDPDRSILDDKERKCLKYAQIIAKEINVKDELEALAEILLTNGNIFLDDQLVSYSILPNDKVTLINKEDPALVDMSKIMTSANTLILYEGTSDQEVYKRYMHIKYKKTPVYVRDNMGRITYGVYSISPLLRTQIPTQMKRQSLIIDLLWRSLNVPREHHKIASDIFSLDKYEGSPTQRREQAVRDAQSAMASYTDKLKKRTPDQGYVTLDTTDIKTVETKTSHLDTNDLVKQYDDKIWTAMNMAPSLVNGQGSSSYASELVISGYVSTKIIQLAEKIKMPILHIIRNRILEIDNTLPVERLDMKFELVMASSKLELFRQLAIMVDAGVFTEDELRELVEYLPLTEDQRGQVVKNGTYETVKEAANDAVKGGGFTKNPDYPETPHSDQKHTEI